MRIISGTAKGTNLYTLKGDLTRPTLDRVKESVFNIIQNEIRDSLFLDLFSGSGAIGLEAASRGAKEVVMCDSSKDAIEVIRKNINKTHLQDKIKLYNLDYEILINRLEGQFDFIYLDPPYKSNFILKSLKKLLDKQLLNCKSIIIAETEELSILKEEIEILGFNILDVRKYGRAYIIFMKVKTNIE